MNFLIVMLLPFLIMIGAYVFFNKEYSLKELSIQMAVQVGLIGIICLCVTHWDTYDTEILNGSIIRKEPIKVHCRHSYDCNCYSYPCGTSKHPSTCRHCDTCYEHAYDIDWMVYTNIGEEFEIESVDRQGLQEPPRWTAVYVGEPYATTHSYKDYIKGNPDSLFIKKGFKEKYNTFLPEYPGKIYDYYKINRVIVQPGIFVKFDGWEEKLREINSKLGPAKQCNVVIVVMNGMPEEAFYALEEQWMGGKKNDVVVVMSVSTNGIIKWVNVMALTKNPMVKIKLRDELLYIRSIVSKDLVLDCIYKNVSECYKRQSMKEYAYLKANNVMTGAQL